MATPNYKVVLIATLLLAPSSCGSDESPGSGSAGSGSGGAAGSGAASGAAGSGAAGAGATAGAAGSGGTAGAAGTGGTAGSVSGCQPKSGGWKTDLAVYPVPTSPPQLATAGESIVDPSFGTTLVRLTDAADGPNCTTAYSYWPTFSSTSSHGLFSCDAGAVVFDLDWKTGKVSNKRALFAKPTPQGSTPGWEDAIWSDLSPTQVFAHDGRRLYAYDVVGEQYTLVKDFEPIVGTGWVGQMSKSADDDVFAFTQKAANYDAVGAIAYRRKDDQVLLTESLPGLDEVQIDKTGGYLVVKTGKQGAGQIEVKVINVQTKASEDLTDDGPDFAPGHSDNGMGTVVGADNWNNRITVRKLASPHQHSAVLDLGQDWAQDYHVSALARDESRVLISLYQSAAHADGLFHSEIIQVATDGSQAVRRLAHHHSVYGNYFDSPRANISRDGCFVAFTSTWGQSGRRDVFMLDLSK